MASVGQFMFFIGIGLLGVAIKWNVGWALFAGFFTLLTLCALPVIRFFFPPSR